MRIITNSRVQYAVGLSQKLILFYETIVPSFHTELQAQEMRKKNIYAFLAKEAHQINLAYRLNRFECIRKRMDGRDEKKFRTSSDLGAATVVVHYTLYTVSVFAYPLDTQLQ